MVVVVVAVGVAVVVGEGGCSCRGWNTQERRRKASTQVDAYS